MTHNGLDYLIRTGIEHSEWVVAVQLPSGRSIEKTVYGARKAAEAVAHDVIDRWLVRNPSARGGAAAQYKTR